MQILLLDTLHFDSLWRQRSAKYDEMNMLCTPDTSTRPVNYAVTSGAEQRSLYGIL
jgi:hypothetical protein